MAFGSESSTSFHFSDLFGLNVLIGTLIFAASFYLEHDTTKRFANFRKDSTGKVIHFFMMPMLEFGSQLRDVSFMTRSSLGEAVKLLFKVTSDMGICFLLRR